MESIRVSQGQGKEGHIALTELLGVPDFEVIGYEIYEPDPQLVLMCEVVHQLAICRDGQQPSTAIPEYKRQMVRDVSAFGLECYLDYGRRRFKCPHCRKPFTEQLATVSLGRYTAGYEHHIFEQYRQAPITEIAYQEN